MDKWIFKILRPAEWQTAQINKQFSGAPIDEVDGFVHFSTAAQIQETADKHFADTADIHVLAFPVDAWPDGTLKWEVSRGGALFPHLYAPLDVSFSTQNWTFSRPQNSAFDLTDIVKWAQSNV